MKHFVTIAIFIVMLLSLNCTSKKGTPKYLVGYAPLGDFRPWGIAPEKTYTMFNGHAWQQICPPSRQCNAVYTYWFTKKQIITEGFAIDDKVINSASPKFSMKVYHVAGFPAWDAYITLNGASYSGIINNSDMTITKTVSADDTMPAYLAPTPFPATGVKIRLVTINFVNPVQLCNNPISGPCITIEAGDYIIAVDDSSF